MLYTVTDAHASGHENITQASAATRTSPRVVVTLLLCDGGRNHSFALGPLCGMLSEDA
jgi:hypothetical protein